MAQWVYLSPHLDDAVFSCGGLIHDQVRRGDQVEIRTIFAGDPPEGALSPFAQSLHSRWGVGRDAAAPRRAEDLLACARIGASARHFELSDCIYRRHPDTGAFLYDGEAEIFGDLAGVEVERLVPELAAAWQADIPQDTDVVSPLGLGGHVDHRLVRMAADRLPHRLYYYADTPYVFAWESAIPGLLPEGAVEHNWSLNENAIRAWIAGNTAYESQISTFWESVEEMGQLFRAYASRNNGVRLWERGE